MSCTCQIFSTRHIDWRHSCHSRMMKSLSKNPYFIQFKFRFRCGFTRPIQCIINFCSRNLKFDREFCDLNGKYFAIKCWINISQFPILVGDVYFKHNCWNTCATNSLCRGSIYLLSESFHHSRTMWVAAKLYRIMIIRSVSSVWLYVLDYPPAIRRRPRDNLITDLTHWWIHPKENAPFKAICHFSWCSLHSLTLFTFREKCLPILHSFCLDVLRVHTYIHTVKPLV